MKRKIVGILVVMLLIATAITSAGLEEYALENEIKLSGLEIIYKKTYSSDHLNSFAIDIIKPEKALYLNNEKLFQLFIATLILGPITIETDVTGGSATKVEFYIDNVLKYTDSSAPFSWLWDETIYFKHTIKVIAYDNAANTAEEELSVWIFNSHEITKDEAIEMLMGEIIPPASSTEKICAFMLSQPLQKNDVISSESGEAYAIRSNTWFIFIDDEPDAFYAHETRYVFLDAKTGGYEIIDEMWPPLINEVSMFDPENLSRGELIEVYSILSAPAPIIGSVSVASVGDYGDAPDGQDAYYGVQGRFPTLFNTVNSKLARSGGHTLNIGQEMLGVSVSAEIDAKDPGDPDEVPNLVDTDSDERIFVIIEDSTTKLCFDVTIDINAPEMIRYVNALFDFDQSGNWSGEVNGKEWAIVNMPVDVLPGTTETIITSPFSWGYNGVSPVWMRVSLTRDKVDEALFTGIGGWDGSGKFNYGEIEDFLLFLMGCPPIPVDTVFPPWWPPLPGNPPDGQKKDPPQPPHDPLHPGPKIGPCGYPIKYYAIIINGGDKFCHLNKNTPMVRNSAEQMRDILEKQGYEIKAYLNPGDGTNTRAGITAAITHLKEQVRCGDRVFIYIGAHGGDESPGIYMYKKNGGKRPNQPIKPSELNDLIDIDSCPDSRCDDKGKCCHVTILLESCHAGNLKSLGREGRIVIGSSDDETATGTCWGPTSKGAYTQGFEKDLRNPNADTKGGGPNGDKPDGAVEPSEAHVTASKEAKAYKEKQKPWIKPDPCNCTCPCQPNVSVEKWVYDINAHEWVDKINTTKGEIKWFSCEMENNGTCRNVTDLTIVDILPYGLDYYGDANLFLNGINMGHREPDSIIEKPCGLWLTWDLDEIESLSPGDEIMIQFTVETVSIGEYENYVVGEAHCSYDPSIVVSGEDSATVNVIPGGEDNTPPDITITYPEDGSNIYYPEIDVTGFANDSDSGVVRCEYLWEWTGGSSGDYFTCDPGECYVLEFVITLINIAEGWNRVTITAVDAVGNTGENSVTFYYVQENSRIMNNIFLKQFHIHPYARFYSNCHSFP